MAIAEHVAGRQRAARPAAATWRARRASARRWPASLLPPPLVPRPTETPGRGGRATGATPHPMGRSQPGAWVAVAPEAAKPVDLGGGDLAEVGDRHVRREPAPRRRAARAAGVRSARWAMATSICSLAWVRRRSPWRAATSPRSGEGLRDGRCARPAGPTATWSNPSPVASTGSRRGTRASTRPADGGRLLRVVAGRSPARTRGDRRGRGRRRRSPRRGVLRRSAPAGQVRWWSATVVTPHRRLSARPTAAAARTRARRRRPTAA